MELRINCEKKINVTNFVMVKDLKCSVKEFELVGESLNGIVMLDLIYLTYNEYNEEYYENNVNEDVPFTIVFKKNNCIIDDLKIENVQKYEIVNDGVQCEFEIVVNYLESIDKVEDNNNLTNTDNQVLDITVNNNYDMKDFETMDYDFEQSISISDEVICEDIKDKYDNLLNDIFNNKEDNIVVDRKEDKKIRFRNNDKTVAVYSVYYNMNESEIDKLSITNKKSVKEIYKEYLNRDSQTNKRIVITDERNRS